MLRSFVLFEDVEDGPEWVATFYFGSSEFDDGFDESDMKEILFNAEDFDTAARYAQQYLRKMQIEEETSDEWKTAELLSLERR